MSQENTNFAELNQKLKEIRALKLVTEKQFNEADLEAFKSILNSALPKTDMDRGQARLIRYLSSSQQKAVNDLVHAIGAPGLLLWMDSRTIIQRLRLNKIIYIQWDKETETYKVEKYTPKIRE